MDKATEKRPRGPKKASAQVEERGVAAADIPPGSRFKGYEGFTIQDLKIEPRVVCSRRERGLTPDGRTVLALLPAGIDDHFGPEIKRFTLAPYRQGQTTVPRMVQLLRMFGVAISKRQVDGQRLDLVALRRPQGLPRRTGFATLDRLLARLHANRAAPAATSSSAHASVPLLRHIAPRDTIRISAASVNWVI